MEKGINPTFDEYDAAVEWSRGAEADAVKISLPGFKREEIRVLVDNHGHLRTRGERPVAGSRWTCFQKDFQLPADYNVDGIRAKFENEMLTITLPKNSEPADPAPPLPPVPLPPPAPEPKEDKVEENTKPLPPPPAAAAEEEEEERMQSEEREKMEEDRKKLEKKANDAADGATGVVQLSRSASASRRQLVNMAVAVVVLLGITIYVWNTLRSVATGGGAGGHGHGHGYGGHRYSDEM